MPTPAAPSDPNSAGLEGSFEDRLRVSWERHGNTIYLVLVLAAAGIIGKGAWDYLAVQKELTIEKDYAACTAPDMLRAFADSHPGHPLAGLAELRVGDISYATGRFADADVAYGQAESDLPAGPLLSRSKLGLAMSQAQSGKAIDAEAGLHAIADDPAELKSIRCEATYDLASLEVSEGRTGDIQKLTEDLMRLDPSSRFAERILSLRSSVPDSAPSFLAAPGKP
jgi:hypothetical protein